PPAALDALRSALTGQQPPLAKVAHVRETALPDGLEFGEHFAILPSVRAGGLFPEMSGDVFGDVSPTSLLISPDVAPCRNCLDDMRDPGNRRHNYPFTNCTQCGPRFTIIRDLPYDRPATSMACFAMCPACSREYHDPANRRFHAQPNACPDCGPRLRLLGAGEDGCRQDGAAVAGAAAHVLAGRVAAIKGAGGFHLACDARSEAAVARLRDRKNRPHKALAVMVADIRAAARLAELAEDAIRQLENPARPIVLCRRRDNSALPSNLAPDTDELGLMLPSSPLHTVLFTELERAGATDALPPALVMTSGNAQDQPLCGGNREALEKLAGIADVWLLHDRDIVTPVDDSVLRLVARPSASPGARMVQMIRRARGHVPAPLALGRSGPSVLAWGADLKNTVCLTRKAQAFVSRHNGDMDTAQGLDFMRASAGQLEKLLRIRPEAMICDTHPDAFTALWAEQAARDSGLPLYRLQHHRAHAYSVLAEHALRQPALALILDGAGYGDDGSVWGGELLLINPKRPDDDRRLGRLRPFPLPGGDAATREPWRIARALLTASDMDDGHAWPWMRDHARKDQAVRDLLAAGISPLTSSCGRFLDAVAALLGLCACISYEAQAAICLETLAALRQDQAGQLARLADPPPGTDILEHDDRWELDVHALFARLAVQARQGQDARILARRAHLDLANGLARLAAIAADRHGPRRVLLGGGVLHNRILAAALPALLRKQGLTPLFARALPPGDAGISLGQAYWLHCLARSRA
ncbi:MAG: carbamoyltransferase HypF, partial [Deltaproteobacteria bacterium]|nr:carbamoyltransferase HypF [Deltaproteobacteria bacterium]